MASLDRFGLAVMGCHSHDSPSGKAPLTSQERGGQLLDPARLRAVVIVGDEVAGRARTMAVRLELTVQARAPPIRNAIYKMMFDARRKLRVALVANGYLHDEESRRS